MISPIIPRQQKFRAMNGAHLASPIRGELAWLCSLAPAGNPIYCPIGHQIWGPLGKQDLCPNFALTATKFLFSNSGNFRAKQWRSNRGFSRFKEPGPPTVRGPDHGHNLFYYFILFAIRKKIRIQKKPKSARWLSQRRPVLTYCIHIYVF